MSEKTGHKIKRLNIKKFPPGKRILPKVKREGKNNK
jgi:hypothetical protein